MTLQLPRGVTSQKEGQESHRGSGRDGSEELKTRCLKGKRRVWDAPVAHGLSSSLPRLGKFLGFQTKCRHSSRA